MRIMKREFTHHLYFEHFCVILLIRIWHSLINDVFKTFFDHSDPHSSHTLHKIPAQKWRFSAFFWHSRVIISRNINFLVGKPMIFWKYSQFVTLSHLRCFIYSYGLGIRIFSGKCPANIHRILNHVLCGMDLGHGHNYT